MFYHFYGRYICSVLLLERGCASPGLLLFSGLQLPIQPAVPLLWDEQRDDVAFVEAEQRVVVAGRVGEDGAHTWPADHVVQTR